MKRLVSLLAALVLCMSSIAIANAAPIRPEPVEVQTLQHPGECDVFNDNQHFPGGLKWNGTEPVRAARVTIDPREDSFRVCSHGSLFPEGQSPDLVTAWVMLTQPNTYNYIQIGIVRCNYAFNEPAHCNSGTADDGTQAHWFVETSGTCGGFRDVATANMGNADFYAHEYKLKRTGNTIEGFIDDQVVYSANWSTHPRLNCWLDGNNDVEAQYACEVWDGGDLCAHESDKLNFDNAEYIYWSSSTWNGANDTDPCYKAEDSNVLDSHCDVITGVGGFGNDFDVWQNHQ